MGKALVIGSVGTPVSGNEGNFFGSSSNATEANSQYIATEAATFSLLGTRIVSGGSGTNTATFRNNSAAGNQSVAYAGTGTGEDATNTDAVSAGNPFGIAFTDTGTDPAYRWAKACVEFASGHGSFHGASNYSGVICDNASTTRLFPINGNVTADGENSSVEAQVQWLVREYTSIEAIQVNVSANARTNDSVFGLRVNGTNTGTAITYAAGVSGIQTVTGMGVSLSPGDLISFRITLLTGVEDITLRSIGVTFKSTGNGSEIACGSSGGNARAASATATYYTLGGLVSQNDTTESNQSVRVGFAARCKNLRCYLSANTYTVDATLKLFVNGVAQITTTLTASGGAGWYENTSDTFDIDDNDVLSYEIVGGTSGSITVHQIGVSLAAIPGGSTYTLDADAAAYNYTATAAALEFDRIIDAGAASYLYTAQAAALEHDYLIDAASAAYTWTANDASLEYTPVGSTYTLNADSAAYLWSPTDATMLHVQHYSLDADPAAYVWNASDAVLTYSGAAVVQGVAGRPGAAGKGRRRRILLSDGRVITPRDDAEYRRIVEDIIAERPTEPTKPRRRRLKGAVVTPTVPKLAPVQALPSEFYASLELNMQGVLNYLSILSAWQAWLAARDEEEAVEMLLLAS